MSFYLLNASNKENDYTTGIPVITAHFECDTVADLPALSQPNYTARIGSTAHIIEDNSTYAVKSNGTWCIQETGTDVYTKSEIDTMLTDSEMSWFEIGEKIETGSDFDDYTNLGLYYVASNADAATMTNIPDNYGGRLEVFATIDNNAYVKQTYICNDDQGLIYTRRKLSVDWSTWQLMTPKPVCYGVGTTITATADNPLDLNTLQTIGRYTFGGTASANLTNKPSNLPAYGGEITVERVQLTSRYRQTIYLNSNSHTGKMWVRQAYSGTAPNLSWSDWYMFEGVQV